MNKRVFAIVAAVFLGGCENSSSIEVELPQVLSSIVSVESCAFEAGTAKCILENGLDRPFKLYPLTYATYGEDGVKLGEGTLTDVLDPNGKARISFPHGGEEVRRIVIVDKWAKSLGG